MKATKEDAARLVSEYFDLILKRYKAKGVNYFKGDFDAYELIAKGEALLDVLNRPSLDKSQKRVLIEVIKGL